MPHKTLKVVCRCYLNTHCAVGRGELALSDWPHFWPKSFEELVFVEATSWLGSSSNDSYAKRIKPLAGYDKFVISEMPTFSGD